MTTPNDAGTGTANSGNGDAGTAGAGNTGTQQNTDAAAAAATAKATADAAAAKATAAASTGDERYGAPDKYTVPETAKGLDAGLHDGLGSLGKELNLSDKGMAKVYALAEKYAKSTEDTVAAAHQVNLKDWETATNADKEFGGEKLNENRAVAVKGMEHFASPELKTILQETGLENHPEFFRYFYRVGKAVSEDKFVRGGTSQNEGASGLFKYDKSDHVA